MFAPSLECGGLLVLSAVEGPPLCSAPATFHGLCVPMASIGKVGRFRFSSEISNGSVEILLLAP